MATLEKLTTYINSTTAGTFTYDKNIGAFAQTHFKTAQNSYFKNSCLDMAGKTCCALFGIGASLASLSIGKKYAFASKLYDKYTPRYIAIALLSVSILSAALSYWCYNAESKSTDALRDALESKDADAIIKAYKESGMPPALLMKEAAMKNSKIGINLAAVLIENGDLRSQAAAKAHPFVKDEAGKILTEKFNLKHAYFSKNLPHSISKVDKDLFNALSRCPQMKFDVKIHDLSTAYFKEGGESARRRQYAKYAVAGCTALTGMITSLVYFGKGQKYAPIANFYQKYTTRNIAIAGAVTFVALAALWGALALYENHLTSQLITASAMDSDFSDKLKENINGSLPKELNDAVKVLGKGMVDEDLAILRTILEQNPKIYENSNLYESNTLLKIEHAYQTLRVLAALNAKGLVRSASIAQKATLLAKITSAESATYIDAPWFTDSIAPATNAFISHLNEEERKPVIHQAILQAENPFLLHGVIEKSDIELFQTQLKQFVREIKSSEDMKRLSPQAELYATLAQICRTAEKLPVWSEAPNKPQKPLPMDVIIEALDKSTMTLINKENILADCKVDIRNVASRTYKKNKDSSRAQMSKDSAKIITGW